jgi:hypothetical protein
MKIHRNISELDKERYYQLFVKVIDIVAHKLGAKAFRPIRGISQPVADSVFVGIAKAADVNLAISKYDELLADTAYRTFIRGGTTDVESVKGRIRRAIAILSR